MSAKKKLSPNARHGNTNAAKPANLRRVVLPAQRVRPDTLEFLQSYGAQETDGKRRGIGRALDEAVDALRRAVS